jgi:pyridinium-3,5-bisthiocarboxylic acid mononucleotide nickel chelatase
MKLIYFDCFSGVSGDMALGALLDAGLDIHQLRAALEQLGVAGWRIEAERTVRGWLAGTQAQVFAPEQTQHRHLSDVRAILERSALPPDVIARSVAVFTRLARAEGAVHGIAPEQVHFHEVGALDAIVDVVGVVAGLHLLSVEQVYASALPLGSGWVRAAHGEIPVPGPATLALLAEVGAPILPDATPAELVTPTGAALLAELATWQRPAMRLERVGYGFGKRELARPNGLRVWLGRAEQPADGHSQAARHHHSHAHDHDHEHIHAHEHIHDHDHTHQTAPQPTTPTTELVLLETNIDDQAGEQLAFVVEQLLALGALDAWATPIVMKKGRPALLLAALLPAALEEAATHLLFRETTTLGIRRRFVERHVCERELVSVDTPLGPVRVKRKRWRGAWLGASPEYADCAARARAHDVPLQQVYALALEALAQHEATGR